MTHFYYLVVVFVFIDANYTHSLECAYCPAHSTEDECNEMNMTQICINETKCGYARFVERRRDLGELYPDDFDKEVFLVTVKKGCMDEDYCTKMEAKKDNLLNSTECIFCEQDMCDLQFPILCVECDEAVDEYCAIQTSPIKRCSPGEVCFRQRIQTENFTQKRGCMESSRCLKQDFCEFCESDICWTAPIPSPTLQKHQPEPAGNVTITEMKEKRRFWSKSESTKLNPRLILIVVLKFCYIYI